MFQKSSRVSAMDGFKNEEGRNYVTNYVINYELIT
jgi:hypothetical protein